MTKEEEKVYIKEWRNKNKERLQEYSKKYELEHKYERKIKNREYAKKYKIIAKDKIKLYWENNKDKKMAKDKRYRIKNMDILSKKRKYYYLKNKEVLIIKQKQYRLENLEKVKNTAREWRRKNLEKIKERRKGYYDKNKELIAIKTKQWRLLYPDKLRKMRGNEIFHKYRIKNGYEWELNMLYKQNNRCDCCGLIFGSSHESRSEIDHQHRYDGNGKSLPIRFEDVRGLLCHLCNKRLGVLENEEFKKIAYNYLNKHNKIIVLNNRQVSNILEENKDGKTIALQNSI